MLSWSLEQINLQWNGKGEILSVRSLVVECVSKATLIGGDKKLTL